MKLKSISILGSHPPLLPPSPLARSCRRRLAVAAFILSAALATVAGAQDRPYFITYNHQMEEPGSLEVSVRPLFATQRMGGDFFAGWTELEYGVRGFWTSELYLAAQSTRHDSTVFTGYRWENRFRLLMREHRINPVLYVEFESINGADKTLLGVVGHDGEGDHATPNREARAEHKREFEGKLILSSNVKGWNFAENFIAEKNLSGGGWEFGYAVGVSRPLALAARPDPCNLCPENFTAGVEVYGGLGEQGEFGLAGTSHYIAPVISWSLPGGPTLSASPSFGLNHKSHRFLLRWGISHEFPNFGRRVARLLRRSGK